MNWMRRNWSWIWAAMKNGFQDATVYRVEFFLQIFGSALVPALIQMLLWYAMFKVGGQSEISGLSYSDLISYTIASTLFSQVRGGNHDFELAEMIRDGSLSQYLLRPVSVIEFVYYRGVSSRLFIAVVCLILGMIVGPLFGMSPIRMGGAMGLAILGNMIHYYVGSILAAVAFFWEEAYSVLMVKNLLVSILSGELLPLNLFPASMTWIWKATPFYLYVFGPAQYGLGRWSHSEFIHAFGIGVYWLIGTAFVSHWIWKFGIRRYVSLGG